MADDYFPSNSTKLAVFNNGPAPVTATSAEVYGMGCAPPEPLWFSSHKGATALMRVPFCVQVAGLTPSRRRRSECGGADIHFIMLLAE